MASIKISGNWYEISEERWADGYLGFCKVHGYQGSDTHIMMKGGNVSGEQWLALLGAVASLGGGFGWIFLPLTIPAAIAAFLIWLSKLPEPGYYILNTQTRLIPYTISRSSSNYRA